MSSISDEPISTGKSEAPVRLIAPGAFHWPSPPGPLVLEQGDYERACRVCNMAKERGGLALSLPQLQLIQNEILALRNPSKNQKPSGLGLTRKRWGVRRFWKQVYRIDIYEHTIDSQVHSFLWCRRGNRIISYLMRGKWGHPIK